MSRATLASVTVFLSERVLIVGDDQQTTSFLASSSARWQSRNTDRHHHLRKARHCSQDLALATRDGLRAGFDDRRTRTHHPEPALAPDQALAARMRRRRFATSSGSRPSQGSGTGRCRLRVSRPTAERVDTAARRLVARSRVVYVGDPAEARKNYKRPP